MSLSAVVIVAMLGVDTPISQVQGSGATSPLVGQTVTVVGVVTGRVSNGYYLQTPTALVDADPATSEGLFIFSNGAAPAGAVVGASVRVTGLVTEFAPYLTPWSPSVTQLINPTGFAVLSTGNAMPAASVVSASEVDGTDTLNALERYEGMRVQLPATKVVAPTAGTVSEHHATSTSTGVFYVVSSALPRPMREPGIPVNRPLPDPAKTATPRFDMNWQRIRVDSDAVAGMAAVEATVGQTFASMTGLLTMTFETWTLLPDIPLSLAGTPAMVTPLAAPLASEATVATINLERFYDTTDDPGVGDTVLTSAAFSNRIKKLSLVVRMVLRHPDIIVVDEAENLGVLQAIATGIDNDAVAASVRAPQYVPYLTPGIDVGGMNLGLLVKPRRIHVSSVTQEGAAATYLNPATGQMAPLFFRPPLRLQAEVLRPPLAPLPITVIGMWVRGENDIESSDNGPRVRALRSSQADFVAQLVQARQTANPDEALLVIGQTGSHGFNDGYADVIGGLRGQPAPAAEVAHPNADRLTPDLELLTARLPPAERYDWTFDGNTEQRNHAVATNAFGCRVSQVAMGRVAGDFPDALRSNPALPHRFSDRDPLMIYFEVDAPCPVCGNGTLESGEQCDDGNTVAGDCCSESCAYEPVTTVCRAATGVCDVAELCSSGRCPADAWASDGTSCDDGDICNGEEVCAAGVCTASAMRPVAPVCEPDAGVDAGTEVDAGVVVDAGTTPDAGPGTPTDGGTNPPNPHPPKGCGCQTGAMPLLLAALPLLLRRRRATHV